jgi:hypothetical protein
LGQNDGVHRSSPVQIGTSSWTKVTSGSGTTVAIRSDNTLWVWGSNAYGALGLNIDDAGLVARSSPVQIGGTWINVATGYYGSFAIRNDYTLWGWGFNDEYNIGDGTNVRRSSPVQITAADGTVSFTQVSSSGPFGHGLAISTTGKVYSWGSNDVGQCGLGVANTYVTRPSPVVVGGTYIQAEAGYRGSTILRSDGVAFWFGAAPNSADGTRSSPVQIGTIRYRALSQSAVLLLLKE